jgi:hypothetical protein
VIAVGGGAGLALHCEIGAGTAVKCANTSLAEHVSQDLDDPEAWRGAMQHVISSMGRPFSRTYVSGEPNGGRLQNVRSIGRGRRRVHRAACSMLHPRLHASPCSQPGD